MPAVRFSARARPASTGRSNSSVRSGLSEHGGKVVQRADERGVEPPAETLVGQRRVRKAVAEDPLPLFQRGEDGLPHMLGAGGGKEEQFRLGADGAGSPVEQNLADLPAERRSARVRRSQGTGMPRSLSQAAASLIWVVFPHPSMPSKVTNRLIPPPCIP